MKHKHFFFDMDGTITETRSLISADMRNKLNEIALTQGNHVIVISGAEVNQMRKQLEGLSEKVLFLSQSGNACRYWNKKLSPKKKKRIFKHITLLIEHVMNCDLADLVQDRNCQISFSFVGHNADIEKKKLYDPSGDKRKAYLEEYPFNDLEVVARVGGTTCIDYTDINGTKGKNIQRLLDLKKWNKDECAYFGDALFKGGNDETVIGVIPNLVKVKNPDKTLLELNKLND